jgi:beta-1,4-mannosyl-glycoprotein beta-1,4-N-acetylglucosaminyltransferase
MRIDSFIVNDELDVLEMRLGMLDPVVDYFVFVETRRTFSGMAKPLYYQENKHKFEKWNHKIITVAPDLPNVGSWEYEVLPRECLVSLIRNLNPHPHDTLTFSDCDEIPNPEVIKNYTYDLGLRNLKQYTYYYNLNHLFDYGNRAWSRARIGCCEHIYDHGAMGFRGGWPLGSDLDSNYISLEEGGWHLSYFHPTIAQIRRKVNSISHDDLWPFINSRTDQQIADDIHNGRDLYHRAGIGDAVWVDTNTTEDKRLPPYYLQNRERFKSFTDEHFMQTFASGAFNVTQVHPRLSRFPSRRALFQKPKNSQ